MFHKGDGELFLLLTIALSAYQYQGDQEGLDSCSPAGNSIYHEGTGILSHRERGTTYTLIPENYTQF